jgi:CRISPR type III-A-associated RAMP protein Csm4
MNPGMVVKLRPTGPWRIGPDSGARNRVEAIYHSDSLYSAVTSAMVRLGWLEEWLDATARRGAAGPAVSFSSCFPFLDDIAFVVPPRTVWPPASPAAMSSRVRWRSARFVPLQVVQEVLAGQLPDESRWMVDGASECLVPAGRPGPFRTAVRWNAAVDRLTGASERHSTGCIEFRPGCGLWTVVSFQDEELQKQWADRVRAAFRLLADCGFGGERSRGWGRSADPEFQTGVLPEMILPPHVPSETLAAPEIAPMPPEPEPGAPPEELIERALAQLEGSIPVPPPQPEAPPAEEPHNNGEPPSDVSDSIAAQRAPTALNASVGVMEIDEEAVTAVEEPVKAESVPEPEMKPVAPVEAGAKAHWLLGLYAPAADDAVDWHRGNYAVATRGGRVESPAGSGDLKKPVQMVVEGSVIYAELPPRGSAVDVGPAGFAHPVYRAGFALAIPLPEVR